MTDFNGSFCFLSQMRTCRSWLWNSFSWDSSVRQVELTDLHDRLGHEGVVYKTTVEDLISHYCLSISGRSATTRVRSWRGLLEVLQPKRFSQPGDGFLVAEDSPGLLSALLVLYNRTSFCFMSELQESFARTEEEALVWLQILQPVLVSSGGKSCH